MNFVFTSEYMNKKRANEGLAKLKYNWEVHIYYMTDHIYENRHCHSGNFESETEEYGAFFSGFDIADYKNVIFNKVKYGRNYEKDIKVFEDINKSLYTGFTKDLIDIYNKYKSKENTEKIIYIE